MAEDDQVRMTLEAASDLEKIYSYVSLDSPQNAIELIERILNAVESLAFMPSRFRMVGSSRGKAFHVHAMVVKPFVVYYRIETGARVVFILTIQHGRRRQPRRFP